MIGKGRFLKTSANVKIKKKKKKTSKFKAYTIVNSIINQNLYIFRQTDFVLCANTLRLIEICKCKMLIKADTSKFD